MIFTISDDFPDSLKYRKTSFSFEFTFGIYQEWEKDPDFLIYCVCYYINNNYLDITEGLFGPDFFYNIPLYNNHLTLDLTSLFIYQDQADFVANFLLLHLKDKITIILNG